MENPENLIFDKIRHASKTLEWMADGKEIECFFNGKWTPFKGTFLGATEWIAKGIKFRALNSEKS